MADTQERNFEGVELESLRKVVDPKFNNLHDELTDCYYNFWKKGLSKKFQVYDVQSTPEESKRLFDKLHGLIFHQREVALETEFKKIDKKDIDERTQRYFDTTDVDASKEKIASLKTEVIEIKG
jgi:hypothetical protein